MNSEFTVHIEGMWVGTADEGGASRISLIPNLRNQLQIPRPLVLPLTHTPLSLRESKMQQRKAAPGRPSGTDGSDFSYRMVVDPRYRKVAEGKSRLLLLIILQSAGQVAGVLWAILWALEEKGLDMLGFLSIFIGSVSIVAGELGRRWSNVSLLKLYITGLSVATVVSVACVVRSDLSVKVLQDQNSSVRKKLEVVAEAGHVILSVPVQIFAVITAVSLMQNMSPKRASR